MFIVIFSITFIISIALTLIIRKLCFIFNKFDIPNQRSSHSEPKALMGGGAIILSFIIGYIILAFHDNYFYNIYTSIIVGCAIIIGFLGVLDDLHDLNSKIRFALHIIISLVTSYTIFIISGKDLGIFNTLLIILGAIWVIGNINVFNFMDGIDGIAGGNAIIYGLFFTVCALLLSHDYAFGIAAVLIPAVFGFLLFNFPPAKIFMGDVGSTFLGYIFASLTLLIASNNPMLCIVGISIMLPFLFDGGYTIFKRIFNGEKIFDAHRKHLYQRLVRSGWSHLKATCLYYLLSIITGSTVVILICLNTSIIYSFLIIPAYAVIYKFIEKSWVKVEWD